MEKIKLLPMALFIMGIGGFEHAELGEKVYNYVYDYMHRNNLALMIVDGRIDFIPLDIKKKKKRWYKRIFRII